MSTLMPGVFSGPERGTSSERKHDGGGTSGGGGGGATNVGTAERTVSSLVGGALLATGATLALQRRSYLLGSLAAGAGAALLYRGVTGHCDMYEAIGVAPGRTSAFSHPLSRAIHAEAAANVMKSPEACYGFWRDLTNLPTVMPHVESIEDLGGGRSHWRVRAPAPGSSGGTVEWDARITDDVPNERIAWQTEEGADVTHAGSVTFRRASAREDRGTIVVATFDYTPPGGVLGAAFARLFGEEPNQQVRQDLKRFKAWLEAGELPTVEGQPRGTCGG